jgi:signal transduction histidine kinase
MLYNTLDEMVGKCRKKNCAGQNDLFMLQYEIRRLNHNFIRLLALYKARQSSFSVSIDYHNVYDCLEESIVENLPLLQSRGIEIDLLCPPDLFWAFDKGLVLGILDNVLNNAYRYTKDKLRLTADTEEEYLVVHFEDNGSGYPAELMMDSRKTDGISKEVSFLTGSTGLGLYFSMLVAAAHTRDGRKGYIKTENGGAYGGGVFSLYLP